MNIDKLLKQVIEMIEPGTTKISFWRYYAKNAWHIQLFLIVCSVGLSFLDMAPNEKIGTWIFCGGINLIAVVGTYVQWRKL